MAKQGTASTSLYSVTSHADNSTTGFGKVMTSNGSVGVVRHTQLREVKEADMGAQINSQENSQYVSMANQGAASTSLYAVTSHADNSTVGFGKVMATGGSVVVVEAAPVQLHEIEESNGNTNTVSHRSQSNVPATDNAVLPEAGHTTTLDVLACVAPPASALCLLCFVRPMYLAAHREEDMRLHAVSAHVSVEVSLGTARCAFLLRRTRLESVVHAVSEFLVHLLPGLLNWQGNQVSSFSQYHLASNEQPATASDSALDASAASDSDGTDIEL